MFFFLHSILTRRHRTEMTPVTFIMTLWHVNVIVSVYEVWPWCLRVNLFIQRWPKINWTITNKESKMFFF